MALKLRRRAEIITNVSLSPRSSVCHPASLGTGADSFKRVLGIRPNRSLSALPDVPADPSEINHVDLAPPGMVGRTAEAHARIGPLEALTGNGAPPPIQIVDVEPDHEILCKMLIVEPLKDELGAPIPEPGIAIALPYFSQAQLCEEPATGFVILP